MMTFQNEESSQTESEMDDEQAECVDLLKQVNLGFSLYRDYLIWQTHHKVQASVFNQESEQKEIGLEDLLGESKTNFGGVSTQEDSG